MTERFGVNAKTIQEFMDKFPDGSAMDYVTWLVRQEWDAEEAETQAEILDSLTEGDLADPDLFDKLSAIQEKRNTLKESMESVEQFEQDKQTYDPIGLDFGKEMGFTG